jgi:hypothetical protein
MYSTRGATIVNVVEPAPTPSPTPQEEPSSEYEERYGWSTPPPEPSPPEVTLSKTTTAMLNKAQPFQSEAQFRMIQQIVKENCPGVPDIHARIDAKILDLIRSKCDNFEKIRGVVKELIDYGKKNELNQIQKLWLRENLMFLTQEQLEKGVRTRRGDYIMCHVDSSELWSPEKDDEDNDKEPRCSHCRADHEPSDDCKELFDNGPQNAKLLVPNAYKDHMTRAIYIGNKETIYLPDDVGDLCSGFEWVRNLGIVNYDKLYYPIGVVKQEVRSAEPRHRLRSAILFRLARGAKDMKVPVFVEFLQSTDSPDVHISHHLFGFMQELAFVQRHYKGPVVGVMVMPTPDPNISSDGYLRHKRRFIQFTELAECLSQVTGVPVIRLDVFDVPVDVKAPEQWFYRQKYWRREQLLGGDLLERKTREFQRRLGLEISHWIRDLNNVDYVEIWDKFLVINE